MKLHILNLLFVILITGMASASYAETIVLSPDTLKPEIGKVCPEFLLTDVTHYPKVQVTLSDFKGKWLFLDFWFLGCSACIWSLPKISDLQERFDGKAQFLMIGQNDKKYNRNIKEIFEKLRVKQGLNIASAYDSVLAFRWGIRSMPHIVIVDPQGIVRYITDGRDMSEEKVDKLITGDPVSFFQKASSASDLSSAGLSDPITDDYLVYQSILAKWNGQKPYTGYDLTAYVTFPESEWRNGFRLAGVHLRWLYNLAYFGRYYFRLLSDPLYGEISHFPILELQDTSLFECDFVNGTGKGLYNYSLIVPYGQVTKENMMRYMQQDLKRAFGYLASVEVRDMPVWKLVAKPGTEKKITTKGGEKYNSVFEISGVAGFTVRNLSMKDFIVTLCHFLNEKEKSPFIDGTGISSNIDLTIDANLTNLQDVRRELQKHGLDLIRSFKMMQVLVIRDP